MATDIERLVISLDADITRLSRQLAKATGDVDTWGKKSEATARRAAKRVSDAMAEATNDNRAGGFRADQWKNLGFQVNDVVTSLGSGGDVVVRGIRAAAAGEGDVDRVGRQVERLAVEYHGDLVSGLLRERLQRAHQLAHRLRAVAPPPGGTGADDVHSVHYPAHRWTTLPWARAWEMDPR